MNTKKDKKLFEDVNKYLYDNPVRTKICIAWVSANCNCVEQKLKKEIRHLKGKIKQQCDDECFLCGNQFKHSEKYDAYYCPKCLRWTENICGSRTCEFCSKRPKYPNMKEENIWNKKNKLI